MLILLLLYLAAHGWAKDVPHDTNYKFSNVTSCPESGYFFQRVPTSNSLDGDCYLCFCHGNTTAICWERENKKCDTQHYKHNTTVARKETRVKRSPLGIADIFFKDAAREIFDRKEEEVCKPYESSFSEGCPPADWCIGCTVCDCDANGHWDCHILSFCDDETKGKDRKKGNKKMAVTYPRPKKATTAKIAKTTKKTPVRSVKTSTKTTTIKPKPKVRNANNQKNNKDKKKPTKSRSIIQKGKPVKPLIIKKNEKNRKVVKTSPSKRVMNGTEAQMSEAIMNTMKIVMQQMFNKQVTEALPTIISMVQKRSYPGIFDTPKAKATPSRRSAKPNSQVGRGHVFNKSLFIRKAAKEERKKDKLRKQVLAEKAAKQNKSRNNKRIKRDTIYNIPMNSDPSSEVDLSFSQNIPERLIAMQEYNSSMDNLNTTSSIHLDMESNTNITDKVTHAAFETSPSDGFVMTELTAINDIITTTDSLPHIELDESENITNLEISLDKFKQTIPTTFTDGNKFATLAGSVSTELPSTRYILGAVKSSESETIANKYIETHNFLESNKHSEMSVTKSSVDDTRNIENATNTSPWPHINLDAVSKSPISYRATTMEPVSTPFYPQRTIVPPDFTKTNTLNTIETSVYNTSNLSKSVELYYSSSSATTESSDYSFYTTTTIKPSMSSTSYPATTIEQKMSTAYNPTTTIELSAFSSPYVARKIHPEIYNGSDQSIIEPIVNKSSDLLPKIVPLMYNTSLTTIFATPVYSYESASPIKQSVSSFVLPRQMSTTQNKSATISTTVKSNYQSSDTTTSGSTDKLIITTDTFSWHYIKPDPVENITSTDSTKVEPLNHNDNNLTTFTPISETTTEYSSGQMTNTNDIKSVDDINYYAVLPATTPIMTDADSESKMKSIRSTHSNLSKLNFITTDKVTTTTDIVSKPIDIVYSLYVNSDELNSTHLQSTTRLSSTKILNNNSSIDKLRIPVINKLLANKKYYEYTVNSTIEKPENNIDKTYNRAETKFVIGTKPDENKIDHKPEHTTAKLPNDSENEVKSTKWSGAKPFGQKRTKALESNITDDVISEKNNETKSWQFKKEPRRKVNRKDIERKVDKSTKKYTLTRVINSSLYKNKRGGRIKESDAPQNSLSSKIETLRNVLKRLLSEFHKNNTKPNKNKKKKTNAVKYLKRFFNKVFYKDLNKTIISQRLRNNNHTIKMLCETFGPCIIYKKDMAYVAKKLKELNNETHQILKSLRIIKGLLRLVEIPNGVTTTPAESSNFRNDIHKLNVILNSDVNNKTLRKLTETQRIQIDYIKSNTQVFKQSVARFTKTLNQIIDVISIKVNKEKQRMWIEGKVKNTKRNTTKTDTIKKFKQLLHNYNIIHNAFVSKLIKIFSSVEDNKNNVKSKNETASFISSEYKSEKIVNNFNKLRSLESAMTVQGTGRRHKRNAVRSENSMEYLLMLMEYMLHQNTPTPVNDGIDLLIEAIKNAPDIKSMQNLTSENYRKNAGVDIIKADSELDNYVYNDHSLSIKIDNSSSVSQDTEERENESDSNLQKLNEKTENENVENGEHDSDYKISNEDSEKLIRTENKAFHQNSTETTDKQSEVMENNDYVLSAEKQKNVYMADVANAVDFDSRLEKTSGEYSKNNKLPEYVPEVEDENIDETTNVTDSIRNNDEDITETPKEGNVSNKKPLISVKQQETQTAKPSLNEKNDKSNYGNTSIQWVEEKDYDDNALVNNNKNISDELAFKTRRVVTDKQTDNSRQTDKNLLKRVEPDSDLSKESDEKSRLKKSEEVLKKKEEDFMNSLDYGTEPGKEDVKDEKTDDKLVTDYFS